jgi:hypothetical protein
MNRDRTVAGLVRCCALGMTALAIGTSPCPAITITGR